jgi:flagellar hook-associated protein 1 FlgK
MSNFSIGISGLNAAQRALDIVGNNIANAATDGYHRQRVDMQSAYACESGSSLIGGGVEMDGATRIINTLLDNEIVRQQSILEQIDQECATLQSIETAFGEFSGSGGLNSAIDDFFNAAQDLSAHPGEAIQQNQLVTSAESLSSKFRNLADYISGLKDQLELESNNIIDEVNVLIERISKLNDEIEKIELTGNKANNLLDQRDSLISQLSEFVGIDTVGRPNGVVDVTVGGFSVVCGTMKSELDVGLTDTGTLGVSLVGGGTANSSISGGRLGGVVSLYNVYVSDIEENLDSLASALIQEVNKIHVQGIGPEGSFSSLTSQTLESGLVSEMEPSVTDGTFYIRVVNTDTQEVSRHAITVDASGDSLSTVAAAISSVANLNATVFSNTIEITADSGYEFDFLPAVLPEPDVFTSVSTDPISVSVGGVYTGSENEVYDFTVTTGGQVGVDDVQIEVRDSGGNVVEQFDIGQGYAAGDEIELVSGIKVSFSAGTFAVADNFEVNAYATTDTSGFLSSAGLNTFFSGSEASDIAVCSEIVSSPNRAASSLQPGGTDNGNVSLISELRDTRLSSLGNMTMGDFYRNLVAETGTNVSIKRIQLENTEAIVQDMYSQQSELSGVNINEEAASMLVYQQMFQAMAKYINTIQESMTTLMNIL